MVEETQGDKIDYERVAEMCDYWTKTWRRSPTGWWIKEPERSIQELHQLNFDRELTPAQQSRRDELIALLGSKINDISLRSLKA